MGHVRTTHATVSLPIHPPTHPPPFPTPAPTPTPFHPRPFHPPPPPAPPPFWHGTGHTGIRQERPVQSVGQRHVLGDVQLPPLPQVTVHTGVVHDVSNQPGSTNTQA
jgi:hypothetical protein